MRGSVCASWSMPEREMDPLTRMDTRLRQAGAAWRSSLPSADGPRESDLLDQRRPPRGPWQVALVAAAVVVCAVGGAVV